jgi:hypothetical protein
LFINLRRFTSDLQEVLINSYIAPVTTSVSTATVPSNLRPASPNTSISKVYQNGQFSLSSNGTLISSIGCASNNYVVQDNQLLVILDPGQKLLITATAITGGTNISADVSWYEL